MIIYVKSLFRDGALGLSNVESANCAHFSAISSARRVKSAYGFAFEAVMRVFAFDLA